MHYAVDSVCLQLAAIIGVDVGHLPLAVVDIDAIGTADEPLITPDAVPYHFVYLTFLTIDTLQHGGDVERLPAAVVVTNR